MCLQFVIVSLITCADAAEHLATGKHPENSVLIMVFSLITMVLLGAIGCVKWWLNSHIHSKALEQVLPQWPPAFHPARATRPAMHPSSCGSASDSFARLQLNSLWPALLEPLSSEF